MSLIKLAQTDGIPTIWCDEVDIIVMVLVIYTMELSHVHTHTHTHTHTSYNIIHAS